MAEPTVEDQINDAIKKGQLPTDEILRKKVLEEASKIETDTILERLASAQKMRNSMTPKIAELNSTIDFWSQLYDYKKQKIMS